MALWSKDPDSRYARYRAKHRKLPQKRQMLCTDIEIPAKAPERAFVKAWNQLISHRQRYLASLKHTITKTDDLLLRYRAEELYRLLEGGGRLERFDYTLSLKVLDYVEVKTDGKLSVMLLAAKTITF